MFYIAEVARGLFKANISIAKYLAIMSDGSTESAGWRKSWSVWDCVREEKLRSSSWEFRQLRRQMQRPSLRQYIAWLTGGDLQKKLVAVATDGASVMMGSKTELVSKLHGNKFYMLGIHCMARCLELAFKYTVKASMCSITWDLWTGPTSITASWCWDWARSSQQEGRCLNFWGPRTFTYRVQGTSPRAGSRL